MSKSPPPPGILFPSFITSVGSGVEVEDTEIEDKGTVIFFLKRVLEIFVCTIQKKTVTKDLDLRTPFKEF